LRVYLKRGEMARSLAYRCYPVSSVRCSTSDSVRLVYISNYYYTGRE
jgi:hypothetical protein